jgi:hypothetical protein
VASDSNYKGTDLLTNGTFGFYSMLRRLMGTENACLAFYDYPALVHEMVEFLNLLIIKQKKFVFYVSLTGNDSWSGKLAEPDKKGTDGPFATLERARDAVRNLKKQKSNTKGGIEVMIRGGIYSLTQTFLLTGEDSGTNDAPVIWCSYQNEDVRLVVAVEVVVNWPACCLRRPAIRSHVDTAAVGLRLAGII